MIQSVACEFPWIRPRSASVLIESFGIVPEVTGAVAAAAVTGGLERCDGEEPSDERFVASAD
jgi:hypothetical protein